MGRNARWIILRYIYNLHLLNWPRISTIITHSFTQNAISGIRLAFPMYRGTNYSSRKRLERWPLRTPFHREWVWPESRGWLLWYEDEMKNADTANKGWCYLVLESRGAFQRAVGKPRRARLDWRRGSRRRASGHSRGAAPLTVWGISQGLHKGTHSRGLSTPGIGSSDESSTAPSVRKVVRL